MSYKLTPQGPTVSLIVDGAQHGTYSDEALAIEAGLGLLEADPNLTVEWATDRTGVITRTVPPQPPPENSAPATPTCAATAVTDDSVRLSGGQFSDEDEGDTHTASEWQVDLAGDDWAHPVLESGESTDLLGHTFAGLDPSTAYMGRVRYQESRGLWSAWSLPVTFSTLAEAPGPVPEPPPDGTLVFASAWDHARGTTKEAHTDGGKWSHAPADQTTRARVLEVVDGAPLGWTKTPNVMQVTQHGGSFWGFVEDRVKVPVGVSYELSFSVRMGGNNTIPSNHPVKNDFLTIQAVAWAAQNVGGGTYRPMVNLDRATGGGASGGQRRYVGPSLPQVDWFTFRVLYELLDQTGRFRLFPRIFDQAGNQVADEADYDFINGGQTLAEFYAAGGYVQADSLDLLRRITMGYEGTGGTPDLGEVWHYADVEVRTVA